MDNNVNSSGSGKGCGIASLVLGILSLVFFGGWIGIILAIIGLVLSVTAKNHGYVNGIQKAGFVLSIVGLVLDCIFFVACTLPTACTACALLGG